MYLPSNVSMSRKSKQVHGGVLCSLFQIVKIQFTETFLLIGSAMQSQAHYKFTLLLSYLREQEAPCHIG